jgi:cell division septation protein DedD
MSWQPNGRHYRFNRDEINACVPAVSGVYGLFNRKFQIMIGESENIQASLLRHLNDPELRARRYRPTDFSFEPYAAKLRKQKAVELIESFRPILQTHALSTDLSFPMPGPVDGDPAMEMVSGPMIGSEEFTDTKIDGGPTRRRRFYFEPSQGATLITMFVVTAALSFYLGVITGENVRRRGNPQGEKAPARIAASAPKAEHAPLVPTAANHSAVEASAKVIAGNAGWMSASLENTAAPSSSAGPASTEAQGGSSRTTSEPVPLSSVPTNIANTQTASVVDPSHKWSVQISAAPSKDIAENLLQRLKTNGHEGYIVQAEVKGQTYYRVRVGHFAAQGEADSLRQLLARDEGFRDAFLARD